jgi:hypothetical protein
MTAFLTFIVTPTKGDDQVLLFASHTTITSYVTLIVDSALFKEQTRCHSTPKANRDNAEQ